MLFVTTTVYALGRQYGLDQAGRAFKLQCEAPSRDSLPVVRTLARLRTLDSMMTRIDCGSSSLAKCRSRAFHAALESKADVWIACDDDVEATMLTLRWMVEAVKSSDGVCIVPYLQRGVEGSPAVALVTFQPCASVRVRKLAVGGRVAPAIHGGFGLVAVSRHAMVEIAAANQHLRYRDDDNVDRLAVFHELLENGTWFGEDLSFFHRVPNNVAVEALITGESSHEGRLLQLERTLDLDAEPEAPPPTPRSVA